MKVQSPKFQLAAFTENSDTFPKCKACRYQRCVDYGMNYVFREKKKLLSLQNKRDDEMQDVIGGLLYQDSHRTKVLASCFTIMDPSLSDMTERKELKIYVKTQKEQLLPQDWSFFALYTTVEFFLQLDFMRNLQTADKLTLIRHSASKCSLFAGAMRTYRDKRNRMVTVDGQDIYPDRMREYLGAGSNEFLNRIRSFVVTKLIELNITTEEYVLISVIVFCNPGIFCESDNLPNQKPDNSYARSIISSQQQKYTSILFQYCCHTYQQNGPTRFNDLLSLCPIIQQNFEDLQYLTLVFRVAMKAYEESPENRNKGIKIIKFRKIVEELI
ncbi:CBN-NHR-159 protein [Caenorhabditis brenneri]|uniref:CBN-NHR-159 protein n=1 Tax=Caenorhabditis brenneri TaxID=135651 RepID=G0MUA8_CAEBE|nr:CBN-NHR-159 protein [Caenorhabditis brenneri]